MLGFALQRKEENENVYSEQEIRDEITAIILEINNIELKQKELSAKKRQLKNTMNILGLALEQYLEEVRKAKAVSEQKTVRKKKKKI